MTPQEVLEDAMFDPELAALRLIQEAASAPGSDEALARSVCGILDALEHEQARRRAGGRARSPRRDLPPNVIDLHDALSRLGERALRVRPVS